MHQRASTVSDSSTWEKYIVSYTGALGFTKVIFLEEGESKLEDFHNTKQIVYTVEINSIHACKYRLCCLARRTTEIKKKINSQKGILIFKTIEF